MNGGLPVTNKNKMLNFLVKEKQNSEFTGQKKNKRVDYLVTENKMGEQEVIKTKPKGKWIQVKKIVKIVSKKTKLIKQ